MHCIIHTYIERGGMFQFTYVCSFLLLFLVIVKLLRSLRSTFVFKG